MTLVEWWAIGWGPENIIHSLNIKYRITTVISKGKISLEYNVVCVQVKKKRIVTVSMCISCPVPLHQRAWCKGFHIKKKKTFFIHISLKFKNKLVL